MKKHRYRLVIAWFSLQPDYFVWKILALIAVAPRINNKEKERIEEISNNPSLLAKFGFIYMLGWLGYILIVYFNDPSSAKPILSNTQLLLFSAPIVIIFMLADIKWYFSCDKSE